jgi:hypothetical protein
MARGPVADLVSGSLAAWLRPSSMAPDRQCFVQWTDERTPQPPCLTDAAGKLARWNAPTITDERQATERPWEPAAPSSGRWWSTRTCLTWYQPPEAWRRTTGVDGSWLTPDWSAVAADYDGVHLSVPGYLTTAGRYLAVGQSCTVLAGWNPDETYWPDVLPAGRVTSGWHSN